MNFFALISTNFFLSFIFRELLDMYSQCKDEQEINIIQEEWLSQKSDQFNVSDDASTELDYYKNEEEELDSLGNLIVQD